MGEKKIYHVNVVNDAPSSTDEFGAHQRLADAISELIEVTDGGVSIGLEGGYGSGKSTIVNLVKEKFKDNSKQTVILFDAWAHQGDPLRRTFLEKSISHLIECGWINDEKWNKKREELAQRRKITDTRSIPRLGALGGMLAISVFLIPVGLALLNVSLKETVTGTNSLEWLVVVGTFITLLPLPLLLISIIGGFIANRRNDTQNSDTDVPDDDVPNSWALIAQKHVTDTRTETIENPNPTSVEFEEMFGSLMLEALDGHDRKLIIALDNLDRVRHTDALSILAAMQTFLQHSEHHQPR